MAHAGSCDKIDFGKCGIYTFRAIYGPTHLCFDNKFGNEMSSNLNN